MRSGTEHRSVPRVRSLRGSRAVVIEEILMLSFSPLPSCRPSAQRRIAAGAVLTSAAVVGGLLIAGPASASPAVTHVTTRAGVFTAFANGSPVVELDASVNAWQANDPNGVPVTPAGSDVTLD